MSLDAPYERKQLVYELRQHLNKAVYELREAAATEVASRPRSWCNHRARGTFQSLRAGTRNPALRSTLLAAGAAAGATEVLASHCVSSHSPRFDHVLRSLTKPARD